MSSSSVVQFPSELLLSVCAAVFYAGLPVAERSLNPLVPYGDDVPAALPSSYPPAYWPEPMARKTLKHLCLVSHAWYEAAKPWLWRKVEVRYPRSWLAFVDEIVGDEEVINEADVDHSIKLATHAALIASHPSGILDDEFTRKMHQSIIATLGGPDGSIPPELLSPPASREPSPRRLRTKSQSPARWKIMRSISDAVQNVMEREDPSVYVPTPEDPSRGRYVRHLDFNHFRTIGMRRSVGEGMNARFVTGERLESVLKELPNLTAFGATEYMDGALTLPVLKELFLRGSPSRGRGRPSRGRSLVVDDAAMSEEEDRERRRECRDLVAVDLTGCVSAVFVNALTEYINTYIQTEQPDSSDDERGHGARRSDAASFTFPGLQRLGLRGVKSIPPSILNPFVLAFPSLTHLDLSGTRATPDLLASLGHSPTIRLQSLALARCIKLTSDSITDLLIYGSATKNLTEFTVYGDWTFPCPLTEEDLQAIITQAPAFISGKLQYLDLSSSPLTPALLKAFSPQRSLRSLGISYIPNLPLSAISEFLRTRASNVEILSMISTTPELSTSVSARGVSKALHTHIIDPLCTVPFRFSLTRAQAPADPPATHLRVVELAVPTLNGLGAGAGAWRIVRSKGGRAWYVDTASGWVAGVLRRDLPPAHPLRAELERLANANGNVSSGVGWHARKMEVLHGHGLVGREDGLYGAVSFAYQG